MRLKSLGSLLIEHRNFKARFSSWENGLFRALFADILSGL